MTKRVALFGGSMNPPTGAQGHFGIVEFLTTLYDEVWVLPVYQHVYDTKRAKMLDFETRLAMTALAFARLPNVRVSRAEEECSKDRQARKEPPRFGTFDLIERMKGLPLHHEDSLRDKDFTFVLGEDALCDLLRGKWKRTEELLSQVRLLGISRPSADANAGSSAIDDLLKSCTLRVLDVRWVRIPTLSHLVSSTLARTLASEGKWADFNNICGPEVTKYVRAHNLYAEPPIESPM